MNSNLTYVALFILTSTLYAILKPLFISYYQENCTLLTEINNLRSELKDTRTRCYQMESILGLSARYIPPATARAKLKHVTEDREKLEEKFKQKLEVCKISLASINLTLSVSRTGNYGVCHRIVTLCAVGYSKGFNGNNKNQIWVLWLVAGRLSTNHSDLY